MSQKQSASNYMSCNSPVASAFIGLGLDGASELHMFYQKVNIFIVIHMQGVTATLLRRRNLIFLSRGI